LISLEAENATLGNRFASLPDREQYAADRDPAPEGDGMHTTAKPQTVEQFVVLKHLNSNVGGFIVQAECFNLPASIRPDSGLELNR
jgi:hypothetical protein